MVLYLMYVECPIFLKEKGIGASVLPTHNVHTHTTHATARQALFLVSAALSQLNLS